MKSVLVEFLRFGRETGSLRKDDPYLLARESLPTRTVEMPLDQEELLEKTWRLRYKSEETERNAALDFLSDRVTTFLDRDGDLVPADSASDDLRQIDLVLNAAELSAMPFEMARSADGSPLFARPGGAVLTRRIRLPLTGKPLALPERPRILFAVASPDGAGEPVPARRHADALRAALRPWIEPLKGFPEAAPDERSVLTILDRVDLRQLRAACEKAVADKRPFTHVHLLAHGLPIGDIPVLQRFGLALHDESGVGIAPVTGEDLAEALGPAIGTCATVTLAVCDAGNQANSILSKRSVAHQLHSAGFPVVVASQLPLTFTGSVLMAQEVYACLLAGVDPRVALHRARIRLYEERGSGNEKAGHDWASLVGYVRLPEGYERQLARARLEIQLASLKTAQSWTDHLVEHDVRKAAAFDRVERALESRIRELRTTLEAKGVHREPGLLEENLGLLGSAEKRLAELLFVRSRGEESSTHWISMHAALERALEWYRRGYRHNLSHHWTGVQALSLEAVLTGRIRRFREWHAASLAAEIDAERDREIWAYGSLAELWLLAPCAGRKPRSEHGAPALETMKERVYAAKEPDLFPIESTRRQLERYTHWWTAERGLFGGSEDLAERAQTLLTALEGEP